LYYFHGNESPSSSFEDLSVWRLSSTDVF
jgi:hypothetical protein